LSTDIIFRNTEAARRHLRNPTALTEVNSIGQTPLHLAAYNASILSILLTHCNDEVLNAVDSSGRHVIDYAFLASKLECKAAANDKMCSDCTCSLALESLLTRDGCFEAWVDVAKRRKPWIGYDDQCPFLEKIQYLLRDDASLASKLILLARIASARQQLKSLGLRHLNKTECRRFNLDEDSTLDYYAFDVVNALQNIGIVVPNSLQVGVSPCTSIYHAINRVEVAQLVWDLGFHDIDLQDAYGSTPLLMTALTSSYSHKYWIWLLEHDANPFIRLPSTRPASWRHRWPRVDDWSVNTSLSAAHIIARNLYSSPAPFMDLLAANLSDHCECLCSENGCTPASFWWLQRFWKTDLRGSIQIMTRIFMTHHMDPLKHTSLYLAGLRCIAFGAFELEHTCCQKYGRDIDYIGEQETLCNAQSDLAVTFNCVLQEAQDDLHLQGGQLNLEDYLETTWLPRVQRALAETDRKMTEEELAATRDLGVVWQVEDPDADSDRGSESSFRPFEPCYGSYLAELSEIAKENGISDFMEDTWAWS
jgi:hypothetical protein